MFLAFLRYIKLHFGQLERHLQSRGLILNLTLLQSNQFSPNLTLKLLIHPNLDLNEYSLLLRPRHRNGASFLASFLTNQLVGYLLFAVYLPHCFLDQETSLCEFYHHFSLVKLPM